MDAAIMVTCLTNLNFDAIKSATEAVEKLLRIMHNANKRILARNTLGMDSSHGLVVIQNTVSLDFPQGKAYQVVEILKKKCKPSNVST